MLFKSLKPGQSVEDLPVKAFRSKKSARYLYLLAGVHGDEVEGVYLLEKIFEWLQSDKFEVELPMVVIPNLNPDGHRQGTRVNAHGVDLNRNMESSNWVAEFEEAKYNPGKNPLSEPESLYLAKLLGKFPPYLILSFHSWKPFINFDGSCEKQAQFLADLWEKDLAETVGYPTPGSLGSYVPELYGTGVITLEAPQISKELQLQDIWKDLELPLKEFLNSDFVTPEYNKF